MGDTSIEWTSKTWNPVRGCTRVSEGCRNCYAERTAIRMSGPGGAYDGLVRSTPNGPRWTGVARLAPEMLDQPLRWRKPQRVFVNSMSDLFHEGLSNEDIAAVFGVMAAAPRHTFQVLTKRPERALSWFNWMHRVRHEVKVEDDLSLVGATRYVLRLMADCVQPGISERLSIDGEWPLPNVWLGVSVEDQATADERIPLLLETPAAVRFVSYEPALGPVSFERFMAGTCCEACGGHVLRSDITCRECERTIDRAPTLDWIIAGSESGPGARPAELAWFRSVRSQCEAAGVAFFLKQIVEGRKKTSLPMLDNRQSVEFPR